jgi:hypothetical protein
MKSNLSRSVRMTAGAFALFVGAGVALSGSAMAQEHREFRGPGPYHTPHMVFDDRFHHGHYYPAVGYSVTALPPGYVSLSFGPRHVFFHGGVWFEARGPGFVVVRPPVGIVVPILPPAYTTLWFGGVPYYYANDVYYTQGPGGYMVAAPPPGADSYVEAPQGAPPGQYGPPPAQYPPQQQYAPAPQQYTPPGPQPMPSASAPPPAADKWYYCDSAKGYYPYVPECKEGWRAVPAAPQPR